MSIDSKCMNRRILLIDDNQAIHDDFRMVLGANSSENDTQCQAINDLESEIFGGPNNHQDGIYFTLESALQGQQALDMVIDAIKDNNPFTMAFVDMRMPPGWDGLETIQNIWRVDPNIQMVICSAYSDHDWNHIIKKLGQSDQLLILKKPFDNVEVRQLAHALTQKWNMAKDTQVLMQDLEEAVQQRTAELVSEKQQCEETLNQLQHTQVKLLQSDKMATIGQLASGVAHEINHPIGYISSNLNTLSQYVTDLNRAHEAYDLLLQSARTPADDLAKVVEHVDLVRAEIDLDEIVKDLKQLASESIKSADRVCAIVSDLHDFSHIDYSHKVEQDTESRWDNL